MEKKYCKDCVYFHQHYALNNRNIFRVYCGHCTLRRSRKKQPNAIACDSFSVAPSDENAFVTKKCLSKELLQYLLRLEFLPQIEDVTKGK